MGTRAFAITDILASTLLIGENRTGVKTIGGAGQK